jgi:hypothetical protein
MTMTAATLNERLLDAWDWLTVRLLGHSYRWLRAQRACGRLVVGVQRGEEQ